MNFAPPIFQQVMKLNLNVPVRPSRFLLPAAGLALLLATAGCGSDGRKTPTAISIPPIARIASVQIGFSSEDDLEKAWGKGLTTVGSHPTSGEEWRVPGTRWLVFIDGFFYSQRGLVVDTMAITDVTGHAPDSDEAEAWRHAPEARPGKQAFAWMDGISVGMSRDKVIAALKQHSLKFTQTDNEVEVKARGFSPVTSDRDADFRAWVVKLKFEHDQLSELVINANSESDSH